MKSIFINASTPDNVAETIKFHTLRCVFHCRQIFSGHNNSSNSHVFLTSVRGYSNKPHGTMRLENSKL